MNKQIIFSIARHVLTFAGGYFAAKGIQLDDASIEQLAGGFATLVGLAWSLYEKKKGAAPQPPAAG